MDLDKFVEEVKTLKDERQVLAVKVGELQKEADEAKKERDTLAKQLVSVSQGYEVLENKLNTIKELVIEKEEKPAKK